MGAISILMKFIGNIVFQKIFDTCFFLSNTVYIWYVKTGPKVKDENEGKNDGERKMEVKCNSYIL